MLFELKTYKLYLLYTTPGDPGFPGTAREERIDMNIFIINYICMYSGVINTIDI